MKKNLLKPLNVKNVAKSLFRTSFLRTKGSAAIIAEESIGERNIKSLGKIRRFYLLAIIVVVFFMPIEKQLNTVQDCAILML
ncbi:MAG TPA: hypothetical protein PLY58_02280 [Bacilli bacterium]|nr:hypothetical protein [Bacilli bacterium]HQA55884.1 hypothetical protein [Bacilli bacterium]